MFRYFKIVVGGFRTVKNADIPVPLAKEEAGIQNMFDGLTET